MSDNHQLVSDIRELDKGITDCENFLAKVLNRKVESSRQFSANKKKNVSSKSASRPQSRGQSGGGGSAQTTHKRCPSADASCGKDTVTAKSAYSSRKGGPVSASRTRGASPDNLQKPKNESQRKRSSSVSKLVSQGCKCEPSKLANTNKFPIHVHIPRVPGAQMSQVQVPTLVEAPAHSATRIKNLSWGEILRDNHQTVCKADRGQWDVGAFHLSTNKYPIASKSSYSSKVPHECEPIKECSSSECTTAASCNHNFKVPLPVQRRVQEESFSSEGTSGFSSNHELPSNLTNKSVQCGTPTPAQRPKSSSNEHYQHRRVSSSSSGASSQKADEKEKVIGVLGSDVFTMFNPVRTLNFLIRELQGMIQKHPKEDDSICRIVADMEKVLHRLPEGGEPADSTSGYTTRSKPHDTRSLTSASSHSCEVPTKAVDDVQNAAILRALQTVPALAQRIDERTESMRQKIIEARTHIPVPAFTPCPKETFANTIDNILRLQRYVENSGHQLEVMCQTMEQTCEVLRNERDTLKGDIEDKDKKLRVVKSQEQDYLRTVNTLRSNLESTTRKVTELSVENKLLKEQVKEIPGLKYIEEKYKDLTVENERLKEENKNLEETLQQSNQEIQKLRGESQNQIGVAEATKRLTQRLQGTIKERDEAQHDVQMLQMEREKLLILSHTKDEELAHFIQSIMNIKTMVTSQLDALKNNMPKMIAPSISEVLNSSSDSEELTSLTSHCHPVCSSPTSTASGVAQVDEMWEDISTIIPEYTRSSPEILVTASKKTEESVSPQEFKSVNRQTSDSLQLASPEDACAQREEPPRPISAVPGPRPPVTEFGNSQWTGAAAVTHELQQNVQELFQFINSNSKTSAPSSEEVSSSTRTMKSVTSSLPSSRHPVHPTRGLNRNFNFQMPTLPDPPKFLETPEFSDFSSYHGSLADTSSVESIDVVLEELQKGDRKKK